MRHDHPSHFHDHGGHHHHHHHAPHHVLLTAAILIALFSGLEAIAGWWSNSLAVLGDAGHMFSDGLSLSIAAFAAWLAQRPPSAKHSYGLGRAEVLAAWFSSLLMLAICIMVIVEAIARMSQPRPVHGAVVIIIAFTGLLVNLLVAWLLAAGERTLNIRAALLHIMGDMLGSVAVLISGAIIYFANWSLIDPILSIGIAILIMISSLSLLRESLLVLMEGVPGHIEMEEVATDLGKVAGVKAIHDLHIWTLSSGIVALSAHIDIHELSKWPHVLNALMDLLKKNYAIEHVTLQPEPDIIDCQPCPNRITTS